MLRVIVVEFQKEKKVLGQIRMEALQNKAVKKGCWWDVEQSLKVVSKAMPIWSFKMVARLNPTGNVVGFYL